MISLSSPIETRAHHWNAGFKLAALCLTTLVLFFTNNLLLQGLFLAIVITLYLLPGKLFLINGLRHLKMIWPFVVLLLLWHGWGGELEQGAIIALRLVSAVALANLVTMTTRLSDMLEVVHFLTKPLREVGLNTRALELAMALVIRMTPTLVVKGRLLAQAWRARSNGKFSWRVILPFTLTTLDDADHVAEALRARGGLTQLEED